MNHQPPKWAYRFLEWYCNPELLKEIQGDAHELFERKVKESKTLADLQYGWNVLRFFRWKNIRKKSKRTTSYSFLSTAMLQSYLITGFRNIVRNLVPSSINIVGLSIAFGMCHHDFYSHRFLL